jgi:uncharacterized protein
MIPPDNPRSVIRHRMRRKRRLALLFATALAMLVAIAVVVLLPQDKIDPGAGVNPQTKATGSTAGTTKDKGSTSTTTTDPDAGLPPLPTPTAASPLRVLEVGDSLGEDLGFQMENDLQSTGVATLAMDSEGDTGLANVNYYDWTTSLENDIQTSHPEIVVIFLGANDGQGFDVNGVAEQFGTPAWVSAYTGRVDTMIRECNQAGARVVWVGMPPMQDPALNSEMQQLNGIFWQQTRQFHGTMYLPSTPVLAPNGVFTFSVMNSAGESVVIRTPDGVHLTSPGAELLSRYVINAINARWHLTLNP